MEQLPNIANPCAAMAQTELDATLGINEEPIITVDPTSNPRKLALEMGKITQLKSLSMRRDFGMYAGTISRRPVWLRAEGGWGPEEA